MAQMATRYNDLDLVPRGYNVNPDWSRNFREDRNKVTRVIDQILDMSVREYTKYEKTMLQDVYFTKYWGWDNYCLVYKMREDYDNLEVLFGSVLESTDDMLRWFDITEFVNFNVYIITPYRTFRLTYLDLLYEYVTMNHSRGFSSTIHNHPRLRKMKEWVSRYREYERYTSKNSLSYHPYSNRDIEQREYLRMRNDNRQLPPQQYRGAGIQPGHYDNIRGGDFRQGLDRQLRMSEYYNGGYRQEEQRQQRMNQLMNGGYREEEPIVESENYIKRLSKKLKIKW
jgi:hypothetical protein